MAVEKRFPVIRHLGLALVVLTFVFATMSVGRSFGWPSFLSGLLTLALASLIAIGGLAARNRLAIASFEDFPLAQAADLADGARARIRVVLRGPGKLTAPTTASRCVYFRASALITLDPYEPHSSEAAVASDGELALGVDSSGEVELDLRNDVQLVEPDTFATVHGEQALWGDPLGVGVTKPYCVSVGFLAPGDEIEAAGRVQRRGGAIPRLVPGHDGLEVRVIARGSS